MRLENPKARACSPVEEKLYALRREYLRVLPSEQELARELEARHVLEIPSEGGEP